MLPYVLPEAGVALLQLQGAYAAGQLMDRWPTLFSHKFLRELQSTTHLPVFWCLLVQAHWAQQVVSVVSRCLLPAGVAAAALKGHGQALLSNALFFIHCGHVLLYNSHTLHSRVST